MTINRALAIANRFPHDFTIQYPPRREYFRDYFQARPDPVEISRLVTAAPNLLLYVHVPFCAARCSYCNFAIDLQQDRGYHARYVAGLRQQLASLDSRLPAETKVQGIDIGGGTPTILDDDLLAGLLQQLDPFIRRSDHLRPVSIETTPAVAVTFPDRLRRLADGGIDRVSMGLQSSSAGLLADINRADQIGQQERSIKELVKARFARVNVDLIFGLPGQSMSDWDADLRSVAESPVTSVTTYDCIYRGRGRRLALQQDSRPSPQHYGDLYDHAYDRLRAAGFHAIYGSLNFSRFPSETGTSPYFEGRLYDALPYFGVGNYASSRLGDWWWFAPYQVEKWLAAVERSDDFPIGDAYRLPISEWLTKQVLLALSFGKIPALRFDAAFGPGWREIVGPALEFAVINGWLRVTTDGWELVHRGFRDMPSIRALFYTPDAVTWLEDVANCESGYHPAD